MTGLATKDGDLDVTSYSKFIGVRFSGTTQIHLCTSQQNGARLEGFDGNLLGSERWSKSSTLGLLCTSFWGLLLLFGAGYTPGVN